MNRRLGLTLALAPGCAALAGGLTAGARDQTKPADEMRCAWSTPLEEMRLEKP